MPPSQTAVEQLSRRTAGGPGWSSELLLFAGTLFLISVASYIGLVFGLRPYIERQIGELDSRIQSFAAEVPAADQAKLIEFHSQILNLGTLLRRHRKSSYPLDWVEGRMVSGVRLEQASFHLETRQLTASAYAKSVADITRFVAVLQRDSVNVDKVSVASITAEASGDWRFEMNIRFTSAITGAREVPQNQNTK